MNKKPAPAPRRRFVAPAIPKLPYHHAINRWTGKPHTHAQEIARRLRQQQAR